MSGKDVSTVNQFKTLAAALDQRHNKRERLIKLSRDVTIESKRIIFLLHRLDLSSTVADDETAKGGGKNDKIMLEAEERLNTLRTGLWSLIGAELNGEDAYLYLRAYAPGLQEYVEAVSFFHHLKFGGLISLPNMREAFNPKVPVLMPMEDFMLGVADLTGEVMRQAISATGSGNTQLCFELLTFLREVHNAFVSVGSRGSHRELPKKIHVLHCSLKKVENVCYNINVRGTEVPKHLLGTYLELSKSTVEDCQDQLTAAYV